MGGFDHRLDLRRQEGGRQQNVGLIWGVITHFPCRREEIGGMQMEEIGREEGYGIHRSDRLMAGGCSCYHILGLIAVLSLPFFPWPFPLRQWCWAGRGGNHLPSVPRGVMAVAVVALGEPGSSSQRESGTAPCPSFQQHPSWTHIACRHTHTEGTPTHHLFTQHINPGLSG